MTANLDGSQDLKLRPNRTFICSVVFMDIVEYSMKPVDEQIRLKERFNALLTEAISDISVNDRIILDTGDGAAIGFLGDPEDALFVAMSLRDALKDDRSEATPDLQVRMGVNLGPVKLLKDINNQLNLIGDGINVSQRIMSFAEPGQLLVSRSYYDIVSCLSQEYAKLFQYQGARADKHIREHDIYAVENMGANPMPVKDKPRKKLDLPLAKDAALAPEIPATTASSGRGPEIAAMPVKPDKNKKILMIGGAVAAAIIALVVIMIPKGKAPTESTKTAVQSKSSTASLSAKTSKVETPSSSAEAVAREKAAKVEPETQTKTFRTVSAEARDVLFTITEMRSSGTEITFIVQTRNKSGIVKSVALYDDSYGWTKSMMTDGSGKKHGVSTVTFFKDSKRISMRDAGTEGIQIEPGHAVTTHMTFKKVGRGAASLSLHPFIYQGRRDWKEYDLPMNLRS